MDDHAPDLGFHVKVEPFRYGDVALRVASLRDNLEFHDPDGEAERLGISSAQWPIAGLIWPSGHVLAELMSAFPLAGRRVLEVGCGIGLASLVCQARGAAVTATDIHPLVGPLLARNAAANGLAPIPYHRGDWGHDHPELGRFDLLIGSDLLYEQTHPALLADFMARHAAPSAEVVLVDPGRGERGAFARAMAAHGFTGDALRAPLTLPGGEPFRGTILTLRRAAAPPEP